MAEAFDDQLLLDYIEGELPEEKKVQVDRMLQSDPHMALMVRQMIADRDELRALYDPEPPDWIMQEVDQHLERAMLLSGTRREVQRFNKQSRGAAAIVLLCGAAAAIIAVVFTVVLSLVQQEQAGQRGDVAKQPVNTGGGDVAKSGDGGQPSDPGKTPPDTGAPKVTDKTPDPGKSPTPPDPGKTPPDTGAPKVTDKTPDPGKSPTPPDPGKTPPKVNASLGTAASAALLNLPAELRAQKQGADIHAPAVHALAEQFAADPSRAAGHVLHVVSRAPQATLSEIQALDEAASKPQAQGLSHRLMLAVAAEQFPHVVRALMGDARHTQVFFATDGAKAAKPAVAPGPWPSIKPDYRAMLGLHLPGGPAADGKVRLPVVISPVAPTAEEKVPEAAPPAPVPAPAPEGTKEKELDATQKKIKEIENIIDQIREKQP